jgi:hypothetical protein
MMGNAQQRGAQRGGLGPSEYMFEPILRHPDSIKAYGCVLFRDPFSAKAKAFQAGLHPKAERPCRARPLAADRTAALTG